MIAAVDRAEHWDILACQLHHLINASRKLIEELGSDAEPTLARELGWLASVDAATTALQGADSRPMQLLSQPRPLHETGDLRRAADWELLAELEYWQRETSDCPYPDDPVFGSSHLRLELAAVAAELERRHRLRYQRASAAWDAIEAAKRIKSQVDCLTVASARLSAPGGYHRGPRYRQFRCPFHDDSTPSLHVYQDHWYCYGCQQHGDAVALTMKLDRLSFANAVYALCQEHGIPLPEVQRTRWQNRRLVTKL